MGHKRKVSDLTTTPERSKLPPSKAMPRGVLGDKEETHRPYNTKSAPVDPDSGQRGAFPGLDDSYSADQLFYGPASDGLQYLQMVRTEAQTVPRILTAPSFASARAVSASDPSGRYEDGAYIAAPTSPAAPLSPSSSAAAAAATTTTAVSTPHAALLHRFQHFRTLAANPPPSISASASPLPTALHAQARKPQWSYGLRRTAPTLHRLQSASQADLGRGLGRLTTLLTRQNMLAPDERTHLACWAWALLGRCREVGTLDSEDVGLVRDLGKRAAGLAAKLASGMLAGSGAAVDEQLDRATRVDEVDGEGGTARETDGELEEEMEGADGDADRVGVLEEGEVGEAMDGTEDLGGGDVKLGDDGNAGEAVEDARRAMLARLQRTSPEGDPTIGVEHAAAVEQERDAEVTEAIVALNIVVTIVAEVFGQRDLVELLVPVNNSGGCSV